MLLDRPWIRSYVLWGEAIAYAFIVGFGVAVSIGYTIGAGAAIQGRPQRLVEGGISQVPGKAIAATRADMVDVVEPVMLPIFSGVFEVGGFLILGAARLGYLFPSQVVAYVLAFAPLVVALCLGIRIAPLVLEVLKDAK